MIKDFTDLEVWKLGHQFVIEIYKITRDFPKSELYGITSQLRRSASSTTSNIAEGFSRFSFKDKMRFYYNARGSHKTIIKRAHQINRQTNREKVMSTE